MNLSKRRLLALAIVLATLLSVQCAEKEGPIDPYLDTEPPAYVIASLTANPLMIKPHEHATIEAKLLDRDDNPVNGYEINFKTDLGAIEPKAVTNQQGIAQVAYAAPSGTGRATVVASAERVLPDTIHVQVGPGALAVNPRSILADGVSAATVSVTLVGADSTPIAGASVTFSTDRGVIDSATARTDASGYARATLVSEASRTDITANVQADISYSNVSYTEIALLTMRGVSISLSADPVQIPADGISTSTITARLRETTLDAPIANVEVDFRTSLGVIGASSITDENGFAKATLLSSTTPGVATVKGLYGLVADSIQVTLGSLSLSVTADPTQIPADGISTSAVTARLRETTSGMPIAGAEVDFRTSLGVIGASSITDANGFAHATLLSSTTPGVATVKSYFGVVADSTQVTLASLSLSVTADPTQIPADGISTSAVTAWLRETASGMPIADVEVDFRTSLGVIGASSITDANGFADATLLSSTTPGVATVKSYFGVVADSTQVTLGSLSLSVTAAKAKMVADGISSEYIVATLVTESNNPVSGVVIDFSTSHGVITKSVTTDSRGMAGALLTSSSLPASARVISSFKGVYRDTVQVSFEDPFISLRASPMSIKAKPANSIAVSAYVSFGDGTPVPDTTLVRFGTTQGTITPTSLTSSGIAGVQLKPNGVADNLVVVRATCGNSAQTTQVMFTPDVPAQVFCHAVPDTIPGGGGSFSAIVAQVTDAYGNPVQDGALVRFSVTEGSGSITSSGLTVGGVATARFTPTNGGIARVRATCDLASGDAGIVVLAQSPGSIVASPDAAWISVGGTHDRNQAVFTARVYDSYTNPVADGTDVTFEIQYGPGGGEYIDDPASGHGPVTKETSGGAASVTVNSGTKPGTVVMSITSGAYVSASVKIGISAGAPDSIFVTANMSDIVVGPECIYVAAVGAIVRDEYNNPVEDSTVVYFTLDRSDIGMITPEAVTGGVFPCPEFSATPNKGVTHACLKFTTPAMTKPIAIVARCGELESSLETYVPIVLPVKWGIQADPISVSGSVGDTIAVYGGLADHCNNPIVGACIAFSVEGGGYIPTEFAFDVTDEYGGFVTYLVIPPATAAGKAKVTAKICGLQPSTEIEITITE